MPRPAFTLAVFLGLSAWAGAQAPTAGLTAADQIRLLRTNRTLLADLIDSGVKLGNADRPVSRAETCQETARVLGIALKRAADAGDAERVAELGDQLELVVRDGLVPALDEARANTPAESPDAKRLTGLRAAAAGDLDDVRTAIPPAGKVGDSAKVKDISGRLDGLRQKLK